MELNVNEFKKLIKKATLNHSIDSVLLNVTKDNITSSMKSNAKDVFSILDIPNDVISDVKEEFILSFADPKSNVLPFLNLLDDEEVPVKLSDNKIVLDKKATLVFEDPSIISTFSGKNIQDSVEFFTEIELTDELIENINKIRKIANKFGKIYFTVSDNVLYIETTDKTNRFSNSFEFSIQDVKKDDLTLCFDYRNFSNLMNVINGDYEEYKFKLTYFEKQELGGLYCVKEDDTEKYFLTSMKED